LSLTFGFVGNVNFSQKCFEYSWQN